MAAAHVGPAEGGRDGGLGDRARRPAGAGALQRRLGQDAPDRRARPDHPRSVLPDDGGSFWLFFGFFSDAVDRCY